ncbi:hypothetical protein COBT_004215, partial [Conglomerata obtusa]
MSNNYKSKISEALNKQLNLEFTSFYLYKACATHCASQSVALPGLHKYFKRQEKEELSHAKGVIEHMIHHEIPIIYESISIQFNPKNVKDLLDLALKNEEGERENIMQAYQLASDNNDFDTCIFLDAYVKESSKSVSDAR